MPALDFGWVVQPVARPELSPSDLRDYNMEALRSLGDRFSTVWVEDHFQWNDRPTLEAFSTMAYIAGASSGYSIGSLVFGQSYRNPALLAKMAANLHYLSGGRFIMGIGAGWKEDEYRAYGWPYPSASVRVGQLEDTVQIMRAMWTQSPATYHGQYYQINQAYCEPRPDPMIPLHIGGGGERGTLRIVARFADAWNFNFGTPEEMRHKLDVLRQHCEVAGRDMNTLRLTYYTVADLPDDPARFTPRTDMHVLGPSPEDAIQQLRPFLDLGVSHVMVRPTSLASLRRFRDEVIPALAAAS